MIKGEWISRFVVHISKKTKYIIYLFLKSDVEMNQYDFMELNWNYYKLIKTFFVCN